MRHTQKCVGLAALETFKKDSEFLEVFRRNYRQNAYEKFAYKIGKLKFHSNVPITFVPIRKYYNAPYPNIYFG